MSKRLSVSLPEEIYERLHKAGGMSNYIYIMLATYADRYEALPTQQEIIGKKTKKKVVFITISDGMHEKLEQRKHFVKDPNITWEEYARRLILQIFVDKERETLSTKNESEKLIDALNNYIKVENDIDIMMTVSDLITLIHKKQAQYRIRRIIPEVQSLMSKGISLDDIKMVINEIDKEREKTLKEEN